jgi:hypothetical protein
MREETTIFATETKQISENINEFLIYSTDYRDRTDVNIFDLKGIFNYTADLQPQMITIIAAKIHGKHIVAFLEHFLSRRYKPIIYELFSKRTMKNNRIIIIKLRKLV